VGLCQALQLLCRSHTFQAGLQALGQETSISSKSYKLTAVRVMQVASSIHSKLDWCSAVKSIGLAQYLEGVAELQHSSAGADKFAAACQAAFDDSKELAAGLEDVGLLGILHGLPRLLPYQHVHGLPQLLLLSIHIHTVHILQSSASTYTLNTYNQGSASTYTLYTYKKN